MIRTLVFLDGQNVKSSLELLEAAERMYPGEPQETVGVFFGESGVPEMVFGYFDELHWFEAEESRTFDVRFLASCMGDLARQKEIRCILIPATYVGRMLAPALAAGLRTGLVADVVEVTNVRGEIQMIRPAFDGKLMACITNQNSEILMMSVRPGVFHDPGPARKETRVVRHAPEYKDAQITLLKCTKRKEKTDIREAKVLVSGGGGIKEHFQSLEKLAKLLHGMVSASRRVVDEGIAPRSIQVGHSGKIVSPALYIALGIYGSLQHIEGLNHVPYIISVNTNKNAPICSLSQIVVEGDALEFIDRLSERIESASGQKQEKNNNIL